MHAPTTDGVSGRAGSRFSRRALHGGHGGGDQCGIVTPPSARPRPRPLTANGEDCQVVRLGDHQVGRAPVANRVREVRRNRFVCRIQGSGFRIQGSGFRVYGSGFRV